MTTQLILASQSLQRRLIMETLGVPFAVVPADLDELAIQHAEPLVRVRLLAEAKVKAVADDHPSAIIVGGDTFVMIEGETLEKPLTLDEARQMLRKQSGRTIEVYTGGAVYDPGSGHIPACSNLASITFRHFTEREIETYVTTQPVTTWSGSFSIAYPVGAALLDTVAGSFTSIVYGLPFEFVLASLKKLGVGF